MYPGWSSSARRYAATASSLRFPLAKVAPSLFHRRWSWKSRQRERAEKLDLFKFQASIPFPMSLSYSSTPKKEWHLQQAAPPPKPSHKNLQESPTSTVCPPYIGAHTECSTEAIHSLLILATEVEKDTQATLNIRIHSRGVAAHSCQEQLFHLHEERAGKAQNEDTGVL